MAHRSLDGRGELHPDRRPKIRNVLFDLDGTLTDPSLGFINCFRHVLGRLGCPCPSPEKLTGHVGPPIRTAFCEMLRSKDARLIDEAVSIFRERYATVGLYENRIHDGVLEMLADLRASGFRLYVATSKPQPFAEEVLRYLSLDSYFDDVQGKELRSRLDDKAVLVRELIARRRLRAHSTVMVGDRSHDIRAARANGLRSVGVTYGYGDEKELRSAGADHVVDSPAEVKRLVESLK